MKKVDRLGRIVIPSNFREKYGLNEGVKIEFIEGDGGITIRASGGVCKICHNKISLDAKPPLCDKCIAEIVKNNKTK